MNCDCGQMLNADGTCPVFEHNTPELVAERVRKMVGNLRRLLRSALALCPHDALVKRVNVDHDPAGSSWDEEYRPWVVEALKEVGLDPSTFPL
jgi:hypothetical protein